MIPPIGIGTGGFDYNTTYNAVLNALKIGYRLIDTAESYHNEEAVGDAIIDSKINRSEITIISKYIGCTNYGNPNDVINSFNNSLKKLKTDYIDIYLVHLPCSCIIHHEWVPQYNKYKNYKDRLSVWRQFIDLKTQNLVKHIGVSNWTLENLKEIKANKLFMPEVIQIEWCPSYYDLDLYDYCNDNGIKIIGYGLFSRNDMNEISQLNLVSLKDKSPSEILIKWCTQRNIIMIPRSNNIEHLMHNLYCCQSTWGLDEYDMRMIDSVPQKEKGHCLKMVYDKNISVHIWPPSIFYRNEIEIVSLSSSNKIKELINGEISCIMVKNVLTENECDLILNTMEAENLTKNNWPHDNYGLRFRGGEIGITIDIEDWRTTPDLYWNECIKTNELFENVFKHQINPFDILLSTLRHVSGEKYTIKRMEKDGVCCPPGVFRFFTKGSHEFPYHTDGFNYGELTNKEMNIDRSLYPLVMNSNTNSIIAILLILNQTETNKNEIDLYNCLVDELQEHKDEVGMYSHWMGTKYTNPGNLENILQNKQYFSPILDKGDLYIFSASRIHKLNNFIENSNRIVLATFACVKDDEIILYQ